MKAFKKRVAPVSAATVHGIGGKDVQSAPHLSGLSVRPGATPGLRKSVLELLSKSGFPFTLVQHAEAFSSQLVAKEAHVSGNTLGKAVLVQLEGGAGSSEVVMCVLRAPDHIQLDKLASATGSATARILAEEEVRERTDKLGLEVEAGAVPALPALYGCRCFMDAALARDSVVYFNAGRHAQLVSMAMPHYKSLSYPSVLPFAKEIDYYIRQVKTLMTKAGFPVKYKVIRHKPVVTAAETAKELGLPGCAVVKAVAVKVDGSPILCALCSHHLLDLEQVEKLAGASTAELASPKELREWFPHNEEGAIPPFGSMFNMPLYIDAELGTWPTPDDARIAFNAGSYRVAISMSFADYLRVVRAAHEPLFGHFAHPEAQTEPACAGAAHYRQYLRGKGVAFSSIRHGRAFTAPEIAEEAHVSGKCVAKAVIVSSGGRLAMAVVGADEHLDTSRLDAMVASGELQGFCEKFSVACESAFEGKFEHAEKGAMPAFGHVCGMTTVVDAKLADNSVIYTNAGTHKELFRLAWEDYVTLVKPIVGNITSHA